MRVSLFAKTAHLNIDSIAAWATARRRDYKLWMANIRDSMPREAAVKTKYGSVRKRNHHHFCDLLQRRKVQSAAFDDLQDQKNRFPFQRKHPTLHTLSCLKEYICPTFASFLGVWAHFASVGLIQTRIRPFLRRGWTISGLLCRNNTILFYIHAFMICIRNLYLNQPF